MDIHSKVDIRVKSLLCHGIPNTAGVNPVSKAELETNQEHYLKTQFRRITTVTVVWITDLN